MSEKQFFQPIQHFQSPTHPASLHPSGLTWERWEWPFKTPQEREIVAKYFRRTKGTTEKRKKQRVLNKVGKALL